MKDKRSYTEEEATTATVLMEVAYFIIGLTSIFWIFSILSGGAS